MSEQSFDSRKVILSRSNLKTVSLGIALPVGSAYEPIPGITQLLISHIQRNTKSLDEKALANYVDDYGITFFSGVGRTSSRIGVRTPPQHLEKAINILSQMLLEPNFQENIVKQITQRQKGMLQQIQSTPESIVSNFTKWNVTFGADIITRHPVGDKEGLDQINVENLQNWYHDILSYKPYFASVGIENSEQSLDSKGVADLLSAFGNKTDTIKPISSPRGPLLLKIDKPPMESSNAYIAINIRGPDPKDSDYSDDLFRSVISGGMSARMFAEIREKRNLSYAPRMESEKFINGSFNTALMDVRPDKSVDALETSLNLLHDVVFTKIPDDEMKRALMGAQRIAVFVSDSSQSYTNYILIRLSNKQDPSLNNIKMKLLEISKSDWQKTMQSYWNKENMSLAVSGNAGEVGEKWMEIAEKKY